MAFESVLLITTINPNEKDLQETIAILYYSYLLFKSMVLWNSDLLWKNYGTTDKTMVLYRKLWNFDLQRKQKHDRLPKTKKKIELLWKKYGNIPQQLKILKKKLQLQNFDLLWKKYGSLEKLQFYEKTLVLWKKNYGTIVNYDS